MTLLDFGTRLVTSIILGLIIGAERQLTGNTAGIRINILVCLGTSIFVLFSVVMGAPDTTRIAAQIVSGVGFLCSGIIFKDGMQVRGLNTAATIWCTAAIGVMCSSGNIFYAIIATALLLTANLAFRPLANFIKPLDRFDESEKYYKITVICAEDKEMAIRSILMHYFRNTKLMLMTLESADVIGDKVEIIATLLCNGKRKDEIPEKFLEKVSLEEGVISVGWDLKIY